MNKDKGKIKLGGGIFEQIKDAPILKIPKYGTPEWDKMIKDCWKKIERDAKAERKRYLKLQEDWSSHWTEKERLYGKPPMDLMMITHPDSNRINGGIFFTSREFMEKHKKWLSPEED